MDQDELWLTNLVGAVLDEHGTDLDTVEALASDSQRAAIRQLRILAGVSKVYRTLQNNPGVDITSEAPEPRLTSWGRLSIVEEIGRGAYGEVYRARDPRLDRDVALKLLHARTAVRSEREASDLVREGRLLARVRHPNVVSIYDADWIAGRVGLTMEFVQGHTLEQILRQEGPLPPATAVSVGIGVCRALAAVHNAGLLHRDVKAQNVMRQADGRLVLMDLGAGRELEDLDSSSSVVAGTPLYLAPEIFDGLQASTQSDVYSVGVLLYHLVTSEYPVEGCSLREIADRHRRHERTSLSGRQAGIDPAFAQVVDRAIAPIPLDRYVTANELAIALERVQTPSEPSPQRWLIPAGVVLALALASSTALVVYARRSSERSAAVSPLSGFRNDRSLASHRIDAPERLLAFGQLSNDGRYLPFSEFDDGGLLLLDLTTGKARRIAANDASTSAVVEDAVLSPDAARAAYSWDSAACDCVELRVTDTSGAGNAPRVLLQDRSVSAIAPVDWTPDGTAVLALLSKTDRTRTIALISTLDGSVRLLKKGLAYDVSVHLSPDGRFVAYDYPVQTEGEARDIFVLQLDGEKEAGVVRGPAQDTYPVWTPDGGGIVFVSDRSGSPGLWLQRTANGRAAGSPELLMKDVGRVRLTSMSRTGRLFYRVQSRPVDAFVARFSADGLIAPASISQAATSFLGSNLDPEWSPDGRALAFVSRRRTMGPRAQALVIHPLVNERDRELWPDLENFTAPRWSPDGRWILVRGTDRFGEQGVYELNGRSGAIVTRFDASASNEWARDSRNFYSVAGPRIWKTDVTSGKRQEIYRDPNGAGIVGLAVSPADGSLAIAVNRPHSRLVQVISVESGEARQVFEASGTDRIVLQQWNRGGDAILFTRAKIERPTVIDGPWQLWSVPVNGGAPRNLNLEMDRLRGVRVSPEGERIAFRTGDPVWDAWVMDNFLPRP